MPEHPAVLLVGLGSSRRATAAAALNRHADALRRMGCFGEVLVAALAGGDEPAEVLRRASASTVVVVPMMMCAGWIAQQVLPPLQAASHGRRSILLCEPIGMHPAFASLMQRRAEEHVAHLELRPGEVTLLLIAHGTLRNPSSAATTERHAAALQHSGRFRQVVTAYLDQPPRIAEALAPLPAPIVAIGCFAAPGHHATHDVASGLASRPGNGVSYLGAIGEDEAVPLLVREMVESRLAAEGRCTAPSLPAEAG
ncbi:MAG: CbiX/SirB N-terminal domain-containing protein [Rhodospirillales bacterium]|nr:CbiX/SirB N-terminal domain-containing protein [Rhodospirillales bacterium]